MTWFDIIKVLGTKSGYSQLDFDNIVEEEDDTCRKRWLQLREKVENWAKENCSEFMADKFNREAYFDKKGMFFKQTLYGETKYSGDKYGIYFGKISSQYYSRFPEEIYCKALDLLSEKDKTVTIGNYEIFRRNDDKMNVITIWERGEAFIKMGIYFLTRGSNMLANPEVVKTLRQKFEGVLQ